MLDSTQRYIKKKKRRLEAEVISKDQYISDVLDMLATDFCIAYRKKTSDYIKVNNAIATFMKDISPKELRRAFVASMVDYLETTKDAGVYNEETPKTLSHELKTLSDSYSHMFDASDDFIDNFDIEELLLTKAKIMILSDYLSKEDAKYVAEEIQKKFDENKVPDFLYTDYNYEPDNMLNYQPQL